MILARRIGAVVLALAAIAVWFLLGPEDRSGDIGQALREAEVNDTRAEGAPQQQVANGWVARDLLAVIAEQQNEPAGDERVPALLGLVVLGVALHVFTSPRRAPEPAAATSEPQGVPGTPTTATAD